MLKGVALFACTLAIALVARPSAQGGAVVHDAFKPAA